jgi:hypothetical protein
MGLIGVVDVLAALVAVGLVGLGLLVLRRRFISRRGGTFDCSLRLRPAASSRTGQGWTLGIARYSGDTLEWYRVFSYALRPKRVLGRRDLQVVDRRDPHGAEVFSLLSGAVVVRCIGAGGPVEFAMSEDTLTGFLSWVESSPPGIPAP